MSSAKYYNPTLENAKFILIVLVVLGHLIEPYIETSTGLRAIYLTIYSFHMPAFVMISGMLSKGRLNRDKVKKLIKRLLVPLLIFTIIYEAFHYIAFQEASGYITKFKPYWILWYLLSLIIWRLTLPLFTKIPALILLPLSIAGAVSFSLIPDFKNTLGLSRTIHFWPFFLMGFYMSANITEAALFRKIPRLLCLVLLGLTLYVFWTASHFNIDFLYGTNSYKKLKMTNIGGMQVQSLIYCVSIILCFAILRLTPKTLPVPNTWKRNTLYVYLWHGLPLTALLALKAEDKGQMLQTPILALCFVISTILMVALLSSQPVKSFTDKHIFRY